MVKSASNKKLHFEKGVVLMNKPLDIRKVEKMPKVNQDVFPKLPEYQKEKRLEIFGTKWRSSEVETIFCKIAMLFVEKGNWKPVLLGDLLSQFSYMSEVYPFLKKIIDFGDIELVNVDNKDYIVPTEKFAETWNNGMEYR